MSRRLSYQLWREGKPNNLFNELDRLVGEGRVCVSGPAGEGGASCTRGDFSSFRRLKCKHLVWERECTILLLSSLMKQELMRHLTREN